MSLLGIDVGTGGCKAAAFRLDGRPVASAYREYPTLHPAAGWAELDSRHVLEQVKAVIGEVAAAAAGDPVAALSVSSMGEAMTPVAADGTVLGNCILFSDSRGGDLLEPLIAPLGPEALYRINPNIPSPNYSLPKLLWLRRHRPELWRAADRWLLWGDLVTAALGGEALTSFSLANRTMLFDIAAEDWSAELLAAAGIERRNLPRCAPSGAPAGEVSPAAAEELHLPAGAKIIVGGHDQCCNALGAGAIRPGQAVTGIGTVECITPVYGHVADLEAMRSIGLNVEHHVLDGLYVSFLYNQAGGLVRWFRDTFAAADCARGGRGDVFDVLAGEMPPRPTRLLVLPYFEPTGSPHFIADASGAILGLRTSTTRGEILKAIMESTTLYFADTIGLLAELGIDTSQFVATGGGARSDAWLQIKADVMGRPFVRPAITECGVAGAAMLAGLATGAYGSPAEAVAQFLRVERTFQPDAARHAVYRRKLAQYRRVFPAVGGLLRGL